MTDTQPVTAPEREEYERTIRSLCAENKRLTALVTEQQNHLINIVADNDRLWAESERLKAGNAAVDAQFRVWRERAEKAEAEIERLRALSQNNAHSWDAIVKERDELQAAVREVADRYPNMCPEAVRRALEPKP